jgi:hypothetical protein
MKTFLVGEYYILNCGMKGLNRNKIYTCQVIAIDDTHVSIVDAAGDEFVIPKVNIDGESRRISKEKYLTKRADILADRQLSGGGQYDR